VAASGRHVRAPSERRVRAAHREPGYPCRGRAGRAAEIGSVQGASGKLRLHETTNPPRLDANVTKVGDSCIALAGMRKGGSMRRFSLTVIVVIAALLCNTS
jgi:hypothetical protein